MGSVELSPTRPAETESRSRSRSRSALSPCPPTTRSLVKYHAFSSATETILPRGGKFCSACFGHAGNGKWRRWITSDSSGETSGCCSGGGRCFE